MSSQAITPNTEAAILARMIQSEERNLTSEVASYLLSMKLTPVDEERVNDLSAKARSGVLTESETQELAQTVRERAGNRCEYCRLPQYALPLPFQIDHVVAESHVGETLPIISLWLVHTVIATKARISLVETRNRVKFLRYSIQGRISGRSILGLKVLVSSAELEKQGHIPSQSFN